MSRGWDSHHDSLRNRIYTEVLLDTAGSLFVRDGASFYRGRCSCTDRSGSRFNHGVEFMVHAWSRLGSRCSMPFEQSIVAAYNKFNG